MPTRERARPFQPSGRGPWGVRSLDLTARDTVLDLGCHSGAVTRHLLRGRAQSVVAVDADPEAIAIARDADPEGDYRVAKAEALPFDDATFTRVLCLDMFEHVDDEEAAAREITRVLQPGGRLVISVPHAFLDRLDPERVTPHLRNVLRRLAGREPQPVPLHRHYSAEQLAGWFEAFDFDRVHVGGVGFSYLNALVDGHFRLPEGCRAALRRVTGPLETLDYGVRLPGRRGFHLMLSGVRRGAASRPETGQNPQRSVIEV